MTDSEKAPDSIPNFGTLPKVFHAPPARIVAGAKRRIGSAGRILLDEFRLAEKLDP